MAKDRLDFPTGFNSNAKKAEKANGTGRRYRAGTERDVSMDYSTNIGTDHQSPRLALSRTLSSRENVSADKFRRHQQAAQSPRYRKPSRNSNLSNSCSQVLAIPADGQFHLKTKTTPTSISSSQPRYQIPLSSKQKHSKNSSSEPKSILKNSPRRRSSSSGSITMSEDSSAQVSSQCTILRSTSSPIPSPPSSSTSLPLALTNRSTDFFQLPVTSFSTSWRGGEGSQESLSRLQLFYTRSMSERFDRGSVFTPDLVSPSQDSEEEILSRCSYRLGPRFRRSSEPSGNKKVTFHDQTVTIGEAFHSLKL